MADRFVIDAKPYSGSYDWDLESQPFTTLEWGWIKKLSGYLPLTIAEGFEGGDPELFCTLAVIVLHRAGKIEDREAQAVFRNLASAPFGTSIRFESDDEPEEVVEDVPPALTPDAGSETNGSSRGLSSERSGNGSSSVSAPPASLQPPIGTGLSGSAAAPSETSAA